MTTETFKDRRGNTYTLDKDGGKVYEEAPSPPMKITEEQALEELLWKEEPESMWTAFNELAHFYDFIHFTWVDPEWHLSATSNRGDKVALAGTTSREALDELWLLTQAGLRARSERVLV